MESTRAQLLHMKVNTNCVSGRLKLESIATARRMCAIACASQAASPRQLFNLPTPALYSCSAS